MPPLRFTGGRIASNGGIQSGTGDFRVGHESVGHYDITFAPPFKSLAAVVATQIPGFEPDTRDNAVIVSASETQCRVKVGDSVGSASDRGFSFIAIGD
jgi:hypothetical protein